MKQTHEWPAERRLARSAARWRRRAAISALACEEGGGETAPAVGTAAGGTSLSAPAVGTAAGGTSLLGCSGEVFVVLATSPLEGIASGRGEAPSGVAPDASSRDGTGRVARGGASQKCESADSARQQEAWRASIAE
eukprot:6185053-Pleurochrysis_carterae.AAC.1